MGDYGNTPDTRRQVHYEWVAEPTDKYGDIIDPLFGSTLDEVKCEAEAFDNHPECEIINFALIRIEGSEADGLQDRGYAYLNYLDQLPPNLDSGHKVPVRFIRKYGTY